MKLRVTSESETELCAQIEQYLELRHIPFMRTHGVKGGRIYKPFRPGAPDYVGCLPWNGRMFQAEIKDADGVVSEEQESILREFHRAGALVFVARSLDEFQKAIESEEKRK
jgi:hypothetical protein